MEYPTDPFPLPADYCRRHAARVRALARDATTPAVKRHLEGIALDYERLADRVDDTASTRDDGSYPRQGTSGQSKT
jgi:hypothetical protein